MKKKVIKRVGIKDKKSRGVVPAGRGMGSGAGRELSISTPELMWDLFLQYVLWTRKETFQVFVGFSKGSKQFVAKPRPLIWIGFEAWLGNNGYTSNLTNYERGPNKETVANFKPTIEKIKKTCSEYCISGAMNGVLNANLTARLEGLTEKSEVKVDDVREKVKELFPKELNAEL